MSGWISLHRKLMDHAIYSNPGMLKLWIHCLLKATHVEYEQLVGNQIVKLEVGQFIIGREALASEFNKGAKKSEIVSAITLFRWLEFFEKLEMLHIKKTTKFSVVTVLNYSQYQQIEHQVNIKCTSNEHQMNTNNNNNNSNTINNNNKKDSPQKSKPTFEPDSDEMKLVDFFIKEIRKNNPNFKEPNKQTWAKDFKFIIVNDKRDKSEVAQLIRWVQQDDFERANVLSPSKLRKRYDNLVMKMNAPVKPVRFGKQQRTENVPDWFNEHKQGTAQAPPVNNTVDFEAERQKILSKLGGA